MKEIPMLFAPDMVRALLDGSKTQTRRTKGLERINEKPDHFELIGFIENGERKGWPKLRCKPGTDCGKAHCLFKCLPHFCTEPKCKVGDVIWVRESYRADREYDHLKPSEIPEGTPILYESDGGVRFDDRNFAVGKLRLSLFMCRWMSRIRLIVTDVRLQRLQDINHSDALAEGFNSRSEFLFYWDSINEKRGLGLNKNPWVWTIAFEVVK